MLKCGLLIVKFFFHFFWLPICFKPYKKDFRQKNIFEIMKNNKILKKYQKNSDSSTACQNCYAIKKWSLHRELMTKIADTTISF